MGWAPGPRLTSSQEASREDAEEETESLVVTDRRNKNHHFPPNKNVRLSVPIQSLANDSYQQRDCGKTQQKRLQRLWVWGGSRQSWNFPSVASEGLEGDTASGAAATADLPPAQSRGTKPAASGHVLARVCPPAGDHTQVGKAS